MNLTVGTFNLNNLLGPVDVWAVEGVAEAELVKSPEGHSYLRSRIPPERLTLVRADVEPEAE